MKQIKILMTMFFILEAAFSVQAATSIVFTVKVGSVDMTFSTLSNSSVKVGNGSKPCIDKSTAGIISIPATVTYDNATYNVTTIGEYAFEACKSLTKVNLPSSITEIADYAFCDCSELTSLSLPSKLYTLRTNAFRGCKKITTITLPASLCNIRGANPFSEMNSLKSITVDANNPVLYTKDGVLYSKQFTNTKMLICYPKGKNSYSFTVPEGVTCIGEYAFDGIENLTEITLPSTLTGIRTRAFSGTGLESVYIPAGVSDVSDMAFYGSSLKTVVLANDVLASQGTGSYGPFSGIKYYPSKLRVPSKWYNLYNKSTLSWSNWFTIIETYEDIPQLGYVMINNTSYTWPTDFEDADYEVSTPSVGVTVTDIRYFVNNVLVDHYVGNTGDNLQIGFVVECKDGYEFSDNVTASIGDIAYCSSKKKISNTKYRFHFTYRVPTPENGVYMRTANAVVAPPQVGVTVTEAKDYTKVNTTECSIINMRWYDITDASNNYELYYTEAFKAKHRYRAEVLIGPVSDKQFHTKNTVFKVNEETANDYYSGITDSGIYYTANSSTRASLFVIYDTLSGVTTDIDDAEAPEEKSATIYNMQGQRVSHSTARGLYIIGGKKVVVR